MTRTHSTRQRLNTRLFKAVHRHNLIYNTCWEDPALDRVALELGPDDRVVVISSAGCNALDYLLAGAGEVNAVDVNPIQNALLELKVAAIRGLDQASFFELFGNGSSPRAHEMYRDALRGQLSQTARTYWDRRIGFFNGTGWRHSFYYRGTSGLAARLFLFNAFLIHRLRRPLERLLTASSIDEQRAVYEGQIRDRLWSPWLRFFLRRSLTMSLLGVPWPQRDQIIQQYPGGVPQFVRDALEAVVCRLPFQNNYFWRVYMQGHYTPDCCPEYLKAEHFPRLRRDVDRLQIHTATVTDFLRGATPGLTRFVLLDHMDWMSCHDPRGLVSEWEALLASAAPGARVIFRSAGLRVDYLDHLPVSYQSRSEELGGLLRYQPELAARLHAEDRVHTYGSFYIAHLPGEAN
jgi:S-adenosylmethionine-diacylglycerol 3-amino-3-carboxypropyl transferase